MTSASRDLDFVWSSWTTFIHLVFINIVANINSTVGKGGLKLSLWVSSASCDNIREEKLPENKRLLQHATYISQAKL